MLSELSALSHQFHNGISETSLTVDFNFAGVGSGIGGMSHLPLSTPAQSSQHVGQPPTVKMQSSGTFEVPKSTDQDSTKLIVPETQKILSFSESSPADTGKSQLGPNFKDVVDSLTKSIPRKSHQELQNALSEMMGSAGIALQRYSLHKSSVDGSLEGACLEGTYKVQNSCELNNSGQSSGDAGIGYQLPGIDSLETYVFTTEKEKQSSKQDEVHSYLGVSFDDGSQRVDGAKSDSKLIDPDPGAAEEKGLHSLTKKVFLDTGYTKACIDEHNHSKVLSYVLNKLDENRLPYGKSTSMAPEKLWDGSLRLNSTITVSAVAFFKSGERLLDTSWSKFVEVIGKVRLDEFAKYIQDLPRSRTRTLMVISVCAKEGSSDDGLKGMKEVSRAYREDERVGLAKLSPDVALYLCPRSEKIFTILAKHGYFKGVAAVEDKSESFVGCVVGRKDQLTKEKNDNISKSKQQDPKSVPVSSTQSAGERSLSSVLPVQNSTHVSVRPSSTVESMNNTDKKSEIGHPSGASSLPSYSALAKPSIPVEQQVSNQLNMFSQTSEVYPLHREGFPGSELQKRFTSLPPNAVEQKMLTADDDDDLPEYDFGSSFGISFTSFGMTSGVPAVDTRLQTERVMNIDESVLPALPVIHSFLASNRGTGDLSSLMLPSSATQGMPLPKSIAQHEPHFHISGKLEDKPNFQKYATPAVISTPLRASSPKLPSHKLRKRNFFCDDNDDDMPEWLPPQYQKPSLMGRNKPSPATLSESPFSTFQDVGVHGRPLLSSPFLDCTHPEFPSERLTQSYYQPIHLNVPPSLPIQNVRGSMTGSHHDRVLRPSSGSLPVKRPHPPDDGRK